MSFQRKENRASVATHVQEDLEPEPRSTKSPLHINASGATCEVVESPALRNQTGIASIPESVTEMLQSLVELQQKAVVQSSALYNLKSRALASSSSPRKPLLEEIETHHIGM